MASPPTSRLAGAALTAAVLLLASSCGGGGDPAVTDGDSSSPGEASPAGGEGQPAADCPTDAPLPEETDQRGAVAVDAGAVELDAGDQFFEPTCVTGAASATLTVTVTNTGESLHNIQVQQQGIDKDVEPGESITVEIDVGDEPVAFTCKYHTTLGMNGAVVPQA
jgi:plastocyanin